MFSTFTNYLVEEFFFNTDLSGGNNSNIGTIAKIVLTED